MRRGDRSIALRTAGNPALLREIHGTLHQAGERSIPACGEPPGPIRSATPPPQERTAAEFGSIINEDSSMASNWDAGIVLSSLSKLSCHGASSVPLKNQLLPLSARIKP